MKNDKLICLNCEHQLEEKDLYCPKCGQEAKFINLSMKHLMVSFFDSFFNWDSKIIQSLRDIWIPNKITNYYVSGKRTRYVHPFRFFFLSLILFFGLLSLATKSLEVAKDVKLNNQQISYQIQERYAAVKDSLAELCEPGLMDSLQATIFNQNLINDTSLFLTGEMMGVNYNEIGITKADVLSMTPEEILEKYNITGRKEKYVITQSIRVMQDPDATLKFVIGNMLWAIIVITAFVAFVLWLLYIRHDTFYVECMIHMIHYHTNLMLLASIYLVFLKFSDHSWPLFIALNIYSAIYLILSMKWYFNQGIFKTLVKFTILVIAYNVIATFLFVMIAFLSAAIY